MVVAGRTEKLHFWIPKYLGVNVGDKSKEIYTFIYSDNNNYTSVDCARFYSILLNRISFHNFTEKFVMTF